MKNVNLDTVLITFSGFHNFFSRFNIAIKTNRAVRLNQTLLGSARDEDLGSLLDEAKTMLNVGAYHENIVNLQGVTCLNKEGRILEV